MGHVSSHDPARPPARVVIADDHEPTRVLLRTLLMLDPQLDVVGEAADGEEAAKLAVDLSAQLALLDVQMPRLDGFAAADVIRSYSPATRIILHTGEPEDVVRPRADRLGIPLVTKGRPDALAAQLAAGLDGSGGTSVGSVEAVVLSALVGRSAENVSVFDADLSLLYANAGAQELYGRPTARGEAFDDALANFRIVDTGGADRAYETLPLVRARAERVTVVDDVLELRDGVVRVYRVRAVPGLDADGELLGVALYGSLAGERAAA